MIINERDARKEYMLQAAKQIMLAARTAPKGKGVDIIEIATLTDEDIDAVSAKMLQLAEETGMKFLITDLNFPGHATQAGNRAMLDLVDSLLLNTPIFSFMYWLLVLYYR